MTLLIALLLAAAVFGVGAVVEGLAWATVLAIALFLAAIFVALELTGRRPRRTSPRA